MSERIESNGFGKYFSSLKFPFRKKLNRDVVRSLPFGFYILVLGFLAGLFMFIRSIFLIFG